MDFENYNDDCYRKAIEKIKHDQKNRIICIVGPTGPTERLFKSSNKIIIDSSLIIPYNEKKDNIFHNIS